MTKYNILKAIRAGEYAFLVSFLVLRMFLNPDLIIWSLLLIGITTAIRAEAIRRRKIIREFMIDFIAHNESKIVHKKDRIYITGSMFKILTLQLPSKI